MDAAGAIMDCSSCPSACTPQVAIILGALLALSVFVGGILSLILVDKIEEYRERRLGKLMDRMTGK